MVRALIVGNIRSKQKNFATFLDQTAMFGESYFCHNLQEMTEFLTKRSVDVIFTLDSSLNFTTPDIFTALKQKEEWSDIPIFLFSEQVTPEDRIRALGMGAADFFSGQSLPMEISAVTQFHVTKKHRIEKLRLTQEALFKRATTDPLTGLHTYDYFKSVIEEREKAEIGGANLYAVLAIKPDHFDSIGETLGQAFSQKMLKSLGEVLKKICRRGDPLCRLDDNTFGLLFPHANEQQAFAAAERIRKKIVGQPMDYPLTISIGISLKRGNRDNIADKTVNEACLAVKSAAAKGHNRSELYRGNLAKPQKTILPFQPGNIAVPASQASAAYASL
ncbi:MAG: diguanylate cyclase [Deltaproteobacteria bacterium]|nr:diguanylate cyclase [Deltaproteobacteria bacterium]